MRVRPISFRFNTKEDPTSSDNRRRYNAENDLRLYTALHKRPPPRILRHGPDVVRESAAETGYGQDPEDEAERERDSLFERCRCVLEVKVDEYGDGDD